MNRTAPEIVRDQIDEQVQTDSAATSQSSRRTNTNGLMNGFANGVDPFDETYIMACDYINYRLRKSGYTWPECPRLPTEPTRRCLIMRTLGEEFETRYGEVFQNMITTLEMTPVTVHPTFMAVCDELFRGGQDQMEIKWGRIVALFTMAGALAVQCVEHDMQYQVLNIAEWVTLYTQTHLSNWIASHDGWDGFIQYFERTNKDERWSSLKKVIAGVGIASICGGIALGAILAGRS